MDEKWAVSGTIRRRLHEFPRAERKVALALLSGTPTVGLQSSTSLAQEVGASGPTVIRLVNRLGYPTYADFQRAWRAELDARVDSPITMYRRHKSESNAAKRLEHNAENIGRAVAQSLEQLPPAELEVAVRLLASPRRRVVAFGGWFSHLLARHLVALLQEVRPHTVLLEVAPSQRTALLVDAAKHDVAVVFDYRRYESDTLFIARHLAGKGADVVLFTDQWGSPVTDVATAVLTSRAASPSPFESLVPAMAVLETLVASVVDELGPAVGNRLEAFTQIAAGLIPSWAPPPGTDSAAD